jgi:hypothetical protein
VGVAPLPPCRTVVLTDLKTQTHRLPTDGTTDHSIFFPHGWTFDGQDHTIFAVDPPGARLAGGVVSVTGAAGSVRDVTIDGTQLADRAALRGLGERHVAGRMTQRRDRSPSLPPSQTSQYLRFESVIFWSPVDYFIWF